MHFITLARGEGIAFSPVCLADNLSVCLFVYPHRMCQCRAQFLHVIFFSTEYLYKVLARYAYTLQAITDSASQLSWVTHLHLFLFSFTDAFRQFCDFSRCISFDVRWHTKLPCFPIVSGYLPAFVFSFIHIFICGCCPTIL